MNMQQKQNNNQTNSIKKVYCPEIELKRHQFVPVYINDNDRSFDRIYNFMLNQINRNKELRNKKDENLKEQIEIEGKLGRFVFENNEEFKIYKILEQVSRNNLIILNEFKNQLNYRFDSQTDKIIFDNFCTYIDLVQKQLDIIEKSQNNLNKEQYYEKLLSAFIIENKDSFQGQNNSHQDIIIDFIYTNKVKGKFQNQRISFSYADQNFVSIQKVKNKNDNLDIVHNEIKYRISAAVEKQNVHSQEDIVSFIKSNVDNLSQIRIKIRKSMKFEFIQMDCSKVITFNKQSKGMDQIKEISQNLMIEGDIILDEINQLVSSIIFDPQYDDTQNNDIKYEIELEIIDLQYLEQFANQQNPQLFTQFQSLIKRFLRNIECIVFIQRVIEQHLQKGQQPLIGQYLLDTNSLRFS